MTSLLQKSSTESLNRCSRTDGHVKREFSPKSNKTVVEVSTMNNSEPFFNYVDSCKCLNHKIHNYVILPVRLPRGLSQHKCSKGNIST